MSNEKSVAQAKDRGLPDAGAADGGRPIAGALGEGKPVDYNEMSARLARADLQMCEMQAHMDELIEANLRLRGEVSEMTLKWLLEKKEDV